MSAFLIILAVALWIICGWLAYGLTFSYFRTMFPDPRFAAEDRGFSWFMAAFGPIGLTVAAITHNGSSFMWRMPKCPSPRRIHRT